MYEIEIDLVDATIKPSALAPSPALTVKGKAMCIIDLLKSLPVAEVVKWIGADVLGAEINRQRNNRAAPGSDIEQDVFVQDRCFRVVADWDAGARSMSRDIPDENSGLDNVTIYLGDEDVTDILDSDTYDQIIQEAEEAVRAPEDAYEYEA